MNARKRASLVSALACGVLLVVAAVVGATTITGTAGNDTLRGGAKADKLNGKAGNDKLYGAGGNDVLVGGTGNDLLVGGPGADSLACGAGRDTARGDARDKVAKDCEVVTGVPKPTPAPTPTPPPPRAQPGTYCGNTVQGPSICIKTNQDASAVIEIKTSSLVDCTQPTKLRFESPMGITSSVPIGSDLSFSRSRSGPIPSGSSPATNIQATYFIRGTFTTDGKATGQLAVTSLEFDYLGSHFNCTQNPVDWSVTKQG